MRWFQLMTPKCVVDGIVDYWVYHVMPRYSTFLPGSTWVLSLPCVQCVPVQLWPKHYLHSQRNQSENSSVHRRCKHILNYERPPVEGHWGDWWSHAWPAMESWNRMESRITYWDLSLCHNVHTETATRWCPRSIAKLVYNSNNYGL